MSARHSFKKCHLNNIVDKRVNETTKEIIIHLGDIDRITWLSLSLTKMILCLSLTLSHCTPRLLSTHLLLSLPFWFNLVAPETAAVIVLGTLRVNWFVLWN